MAFDSQTFLATATGNPGVYQMYGMKTQGEPESLLYVGKAGNLKKDWPVIFVPVVWGLRRRRW